MSKVVCKTKRIGGGFGGKETMSAFFADVAAVPSYLFNRPVKLTLDRDVDMMTTGHQHSFLGNYKVYVDGTNSNKVALLIKHVYKNAFFLSMILSMAKPLTNDGNIVRT
ncbi:hypothetical protein POM88_022211 [Heracleum sosnowskyi]|uniref:Aldehyde oxidase/xanthine dehydrogenase first molybdopterin binding domain-containing protein n=1 Tax=Heracleum sosnowskyi TaxID=360622 RepID=A0AAD8IGE7_9APIA|nr:hypothetical protein POM88_022211 [Heracleum sosnowskyi]